MASPNDSLIICTSSAKNASANVRELLHYDPRLLLQSRVNSSRGACCCTLPHPLPYLDRDTSTTLSIKVAKANNAPNKRQISANVIFTPYMRRDCRNGVVSTNNSDLNRIVVAFAGKA